MGIKNRKNLLDSAFGLRKKQPNLLFQKRIKQNFNIEVIPENLKEEEKPDVVIFENCKEDLLDIIEGIKIII